MKEQVLLQVRTCLPHDLEQSTGPCVNSSSSLWSWSGSVATSSTHYSWSLRRLRGSHADAVLLPLGAFALVFLLGCWRRSHALALSKWRPKKRKLSFSYEERRVRSRDRLETSEKKTGCRYFVHGNVGGLTWCCGTLLVFIDLSDAFNTTLGYNF